LIETTLSDGLPFSEGNGDVVPVRPEFFFEHGRQFPVEIPRAVGHLQQAVACISTNRVHGCAIHPTCGRQNLKTEV